MRDYLKTPEPRDVAVTAKVTTSDRRLLERVASAMGVSLSTYVAHVATDAAREEALKRWSDDRT